MNNDNPYESPTTPIDITATDGGELQLHKRPIGHGWLWITEGWRLFTTRPLMWIALFLVFIVIHILFGIFPLVWMITWVFGTTFSAGFMSAAAASQRGEAININHLFDGFRHNRIGSLIGLQVLLTLLVVCIIVAIGAIGFYALGLGSGSTEDLSPALFASMGILIPLLLMLFIPIMMGYMFSVPLIFFDGIPVLQAFKMSCKACLKNMLPMFWYSLIVIVLSFIAALALGLGFLVLFPVLSAAWYSMYYDIFHGHQTGSH